MFQITIGTKKEKKLKNRVKLRISIKEFRSLDTAKHSGILRLFSPQYGCEKGFSEVLVHFRVLYPQKWGQDLSCYIFRPIVCEILQVKKP